jgi:hypothetical protein
VATATAVFHGAASHGRRRMTGSCFMISNRKLWRRRIGRMGTFTHLPPDLPVSARQSVETKLYSQRLSLVENGFEIRQFRHGVLQSAPR